MSDYVTEYRAMVAALDNTLANERNRRRIRSVCPDCGAPESADTCNPEPPEPGDGPDRAGWHFPTL